MATVPLATRPAWLPRDGALASLLRPRLAVPAVGLAVSAAELAVADRKYGVFTGGFGQSHAVDTLGERIVFFAAYGISQLALVLAVWCCCAWLGRTHGRSMATLHFAFLFGGGLLATLTASYQ